MGPAFRDLMEQSLNDPEMMVHGPKARCGNDLHMRACHTRGRGTRRQTRDRVLLALP